MSIEYRHNTSSQLDILYHLQNVSSAFVHDLSNRVDVKEYSQKLFSLAEREEAWSGDNLIGLVAYYINHDTQKVFITNVSVDIRFQKQGIATTLLENVKCVAVNERMNLISLEVAQDERLIDFYRHNGFVEEKQIPNGNKILIKNLVPIVVIRCTVYNHEPYLRDCLEGFAMQQTNFPFVAIVHDDASTDGSAAIIREYEEKYPDIIKPIYETENQYSKRDGSLGRIMSAAIEATGAKYVAMCEGDDYWTDPLKLQKQVDFLEANLDFGFIGTRCLIKKSDVLTSEIYPLPKIIDVDGVEQYGDVFESFALYGPVTRTCSLMYRNSLLVDEKNLSGDYYMQAILASKSKFARLSSESCVYRIHSSGVSNDKTHQGMLNYIRWYVDQRLQINRRFPEIHPFDEQELYDMLEYKKMQISILQFDYTSYLNSKKAIKTPAYKKKILYRLIIGKLSFYIISKLYCLKN